MTSSLAAQLANVRSLNADRLASSASLVKHTSYLFQPKTASQQDLFTVFSLGTSGWSELSSEDESLSAWQGANLLFGEESRTTDRLMLPKEENDAIDQSVREFLQLAGSHLLSKPASKCLEWLVRRFRIHEFCVDDVLAAFLPYHDTQQFARMLAICKLEGKPHLQFLLSVKKSASPLPTRILLDALLAPAQTTTSLDLIRWITSLITIDTHKQLKVAPHRALVNFWVSTLVQMCTARSQFDSQTAPKSASLKRGSAKARAAEAQSILTILLPATVRVAGTSSLGIDAQVGGLMVLCATARSFPLSKEAVQGIFVSLAKLGSGSVVSPVVCRALISSAITLCACVQDPPNPLSRLSNPSTRLVPNSIAAFLTTQPEAEATIISLANKYECRIFLVHFIAAIVVRLSDDASADLLIALLKAYSLPTEVRVQALELLLQLQLQAKQQQQPAEGTDVFEAQFPQNARLAAHKNRLRALSLIRGEYAAAFDTALRNSTGGTADEAQISSVWQTTQAVLALESGSTLEDAASGSSQANTNILWLSIHSSDASQRALALQQLYKDVSSSRVSVQDSMVQEALQARIQDSSTDVLKVLYSQSSSLLEAFDPDTLLSMVVEALHVQYLDEAVLSLHTSFLLTSFLEAHEDYVDRIAQSALWPFLLETQDGLRLTTAVYRLLPNAKAGRMFAALSAVRPAEVDETAVKAHQRNDAVAAQIAKYVSEISQQDAKSSWVNFLTSHAVLEKQSSARDLANLVLIHLFDHIDSLEVSQLGYDVMQKIVVQTLSSATAAAPQEREIKISLQQALQASTHQSVLSALYHQPGSSQVARLLSLHLLAQLVRRVDVLSFGDFLSTKESEANSSARDLLGCLYSNINVSSIDASMSKLLLQMLLVRLGESVLPFLAFIWTSPQSYTKAIRLAAIRHGEAYLQAHAEAQKDTKDPKDFQTIVPSLLVLLPDDEASIRMAAISCLEHVRQITRDAISLIGASKKKGKEADILGYDVIYGSVPSKDLQYVDLASLAFYLNQMLERKTAFRNDARFLPQLHSDVLNITRNDGRKEVNHKHGVICFLLSHAICWRSLPIRLVLLKSLAGVNDAAKLRMLHPLIRKIIRSNNLAVELAGLSAGEERQEYLDLLFLSYDHTSRSTLEDESNGAWKDFLNALEQGKHKKLLVQKSAIRALQNPEFFASLDQAKRQQVFLHLAKVVADPASAASPELQAALRDLSVDSDVLVPVLSDLRDAITAKALDAPEAKRARTLLASDEDIKRNCSVLVVILEAGVGKKLTRSGILVFELFEVARLAVELQSSGGSANAELILQLAMSCVSNLLEGLTKPDGSVVPADIVQSLRADTIVSAIKTSKNPQTFQHALLLLSRIASIAPETVLHNVMPIFTFVGSTVLQRDDAFSFTVVEQVLRSIVPALVVSIKTSEGAAPAKSSKFDLLCEARSFIRIFTDAATHVPRHRRQMFFRLLVDILGAADFSSAVAMLLVDRSAHKIVKQPKSDAEQTLQLPMAVVSPHSAMVQVDVLKDTWEEIIRIWQHRDETEMLSDQVFLDRAGRMEKEHIDNQFEPLRQIQALIMFIHQVLISKSFAEKLAKVSPSKIGPHLETFVRLSLQVSNLTKNAQPTIAALASAALDAAMPFVPVENIMKVVSALVQEESAEDDLATKTSGMTLFASRVSVMPAGSSDRQTVASFTPSLLKTITESISDSINSKAHKAASVAEMDAFRQSALDALQTISTHALNSEHGALASTLPTLVKLGKVGAKVDNEKDAVRVLSIPTPARLSVFAIARRLADQLGPRLIPHIASIVPFCLSVIQQSSIGVRKGDADAMDTSAAAAGGSVNTNVSSLRVGALDTLAGLFGSVSTFMTSYIPQVIKMSVSPDLKMAMASASGSSTTASERSLNQLLSTMIRKIPAKEVFDSCFKIWDQEVGVLTTATATAEGKGNEGDKVDKLVGISEFLGRVLRQSDRDAINGTYKSIYRFILRAVDLRRTHHASLSWTSIGRIEDSLIGSTFIRLVMKLNETSFRPLFLRMFDWAVLDLVDNDDDVDDSGDNGNDVGITARQVVLFKTFNALSETLKGLVSSYYTVLLDQVIELLTSFTKFKPIPSSTTQQHLQLRMKKDLWRVVMKSLLLSARYDQQGGAFWSSARLAKLSKPLFAQLKLLSQASAREGKSGSRGSSMTMVLMDSEDMSPVFEDVIVNLARNVNDEGTLKMLNTTLLQFCSSSSNNTHGIRKVALSTVTKLWATQSSSTSTTSGVGSSATLLFAVPETIPQLSELLDDDSQEIVQLALDFRTQIEKCLGENLDTYLN